MSNYNLIQQQFWPKNTHQKVQLILTRTLTLTGTLLLLEYRLARQAALITTTMLATTKQLGWLCLIRRAASEPEGEAEREAQKERGREREKSVENKKRNPSSRARFTLIAPQAQSQCLSACV